MAKLEDKYLKKKKYFGELEVRFPKGAIYNELLELIGKNSNQINFEDRTSDYKIDNLNVVIKEMLIHLTNVEDSDFWSNKSDEEVLEILEDANGDFKDVIHELLDIIVEIGNDMRKENNRKLQVTRNWIVGITKEITLSSDIDKSLKKFGLDMDKLSKIQAGDKTAIEEFQKSLLEKKKREYKKNK